MGDVTYHLDRSRRIERVPDIAFLAAHRMPTGEPRRRPFEGAPDLAIEVTSPNDRVTTLARKIRQYLEAGCLRVWVAQPEERQLTVYWPDGSAHVYGEDAVLTSDDAGFAVEGFAVRVGDLFDQDAS
jgi:Uma2 family endonuclease